MCKALIHWNSRLKQLYLSNKMSTSVVKVGHSDVRVLERLKEELVWVIDEWL